MSSEHGKSDPDPLKVFQRNRRIAFAILLSGCAATAIFLLCLDRFPPGRWIAVATSLLTAGSIFLLKAPLPEQQSKDGEALDKERAELQQLRADLETWQAEQQDAFRKQSDRIEERNRELLERASRLQEFMEYPVSGQEPAGNSVQLSEQDREVNRLLEEEAERVYEQIRSNAYTNEQGVDVEKIREEALDLIRRVATVYAPESNNPILETSVEQLARAVSRICLHTLVLLEQLPLDVQKYTINELHTWVSNAVRTYGAYKQVAPWLKHISRTAYIGRFVAGASPVTLGAWWLATEIGRRGTAKVVENVVDRQAVGLLHDVVTVLGTEIANIYGTGYRQRDAAWVYGTELAELLCTFPVSRDSLSQGLKEVSALPLKNEYDRIYLYRCLAEHHGSTMKLTDPAILTRAEREDIAARLEAFFRDYIFADTEDAQAEWQVGVEARLDLRLKLSDAAAETPNDAVKAAARSVYGFLTTVVAVDPTAAVTLLEGTELVSMVPLEHRSELFKQLATQPASFEPPQLDPSSAAADTYIRSLMTTAIQSGLLESHAEQLLIETACYFRRSQADAQQLLAACFQQELQHRTSEEVDLPSELPLLSALFRQANAAETLIAVYRDVSWDNRTDDDVLLAVYSHSSESRAVLLKGSEPEPLWRSDKSVTVERIKGVFLDDCLIRGGDWKASSSSSIKLEGTIRGGGYRRYFQSVIGLNENADSFD